MKQKPWIFALITVFFWATSSVMIRLTFNSISTVHFATARNWIGAIILFVFCLIKRMPPPKASDVPLFFLAGILGFVLYSFCFNTGFMYVTAATGNVVMAVVPVFTALIAQLFFKERIRILGWVFICFSFSGILILILWNGILSINSGVFWILAAALLNSVYSLIQRRLTRNYTALQSSTYSLIAAAISLSPLLPGAIREMVVAPPDAIYVIIFIGIFSCGVSYLCWSKALSLAKRTADVTNYLYLPPFIAALVAFAMFNELPDWGTAVGGVIIMLGIWMFQKKA